MKIVGPGGSAACVFQPLRQVGKGLDGELAQLVPHAGLTSAQTNAVIPAGTPLPSRSLSTETRIPHKPPGPRQFSNFGVIFFGSSSAFTKNRSCNALEVLTRQRNPPNRPKSRPRLHLNRSLWPISCKRGKCGGAFRAHVRNACI